MYTSKPKALVGNATCHSFPSIVQILNNALLRVQLINVSERLNEMVKRFFAFWANSGHNNFLFIVLCSCIFLLVSLIRHHISLCGLTFI